MSQINGLPQATTEITQTTKIGLGLSNLLFKSERIKVNHHLREREKKKTKKKKLGFKGLGLNSCVALRKPLIRESNQIKRLQFAREH